MWQFNKGIWYDGRADAYIVEWKGKKLQFLSTNTSSALFKQDKVAFLAITGAKILKEVKEDSWLLAVQAVEPVGDATPFSQLTPIPLYSSKIRLPSLLSLGLKF